jgi:hypothetical protein
MIRAALALGLVVVAAPAAAGERPFSWDRYHERVDACADKDRIAAQCAQGVAFCDELASRQAMRACSAFTGERR